MTLAQPRVWGGFPELRAGILWALIRKKRRYVEDISIEIIKEKTKLLQVVETFIVGIRYNEGMKSKKIATKE
jgi:hypothetical protein